MSKILIIKNDRVGDLFNSLNGINAILEDNPNAHIEIILSNITKKLNFLFSLNNIKITYLPYRLSLLDKIKLIIRLYWDSFDKIYILSPKNFYFYLPLFFKSKFFAITIKNLNKSRPFNFLLKNLTKYKINDRVNKKKSDSISSLIFELCATKSFLSYKNNLNNNAPCTKFFYSKMKLFENFIHVHYKDSIFSKNGWSNEDFFNFLENLSQKKKLIVTSDYGNFDYHKNFLKRLSHLDFDNFVDQINFNQNIHYLHNIDTCDLFKLISLTDVTISPHGAMTVMASYLKKKVIDIFDVNITINSFREFKPNNDNYNFIIIKSDFKKVLYKINNFL